LASGCYDRGLKVSEGASLLETCTVNSIDFTDYLSADFGEFLVLEFITKEDSCGMLKQRGRAFGVEQVRRWADQLLDALDYLHSQEPPIIHRDVTSNLEVTAKGEITLLDFGQRKETTRSYDIYREEPTSLPSRIA